MPVPRDRTALDWFDAPETRTLYRARLAVLLQSLERYVPNPHSRGNLLAHIRTVVELCALDGFEAGRVAGREAGLREGSRPLGDALERRGLPRDADLATLIRHERANAALSATFDAMRDATVCGSYPNCNPKHCPTHGSDRPEKISEKTSERKSNQP